MPYSHFSVWSKEKQPGVAKREYIMQNKAWCYLHLYVATAKKLAIEHYWFFNSKVDKKMGKHGARRLFVGSLKGKGITCSYSPHFTTSVLRQSARRPHVPVIINPPDIGHDYFPPWPPLSSQPQSITAFGRENVFTIVPNYTAWWQGYLRIWTTCGSIANFPLLNWSKHLPLRIVRYMCLNVCKTHMC